MVLVSVLVKTDWEQSLVLHGLDLVSKETNRILTSFGTSCYISVLKKLRICKN